MDNKTIGVIPNWRTIIEYKIYECKDILNKKKVIPNPISVLNCGNIVPSANINVGNSSILRIINPEENGFTLTIIPFPVMPSIIIQIYNGWCIIAVVNPRYLK